MAAPQTTSMFKQADFVRRYKLAEKLTGLFARPLINQTAIASYSKNPIILENACGTGAISSALHQTLPDQVKQSWKLTCGDFSDAMIEVTKQRAADEGWQNAEVKNVDAQDTKLPSDYYSHVLTAFAIPMLPDNDAALKECLRILQPGGTYASTNWKTTPQIAIMLSSLEALTPELPLPDAEQFQKNIRKDWDDEAVIKSALENIGFTEVKVTPVTDKVSFPIAEFVEMNKSFTPAFLGRFWTKEQQEQHAGRVPDVMQEWLEKKFGVDGVVTLEPTVMVVTAKKP
ncbi:gliotoxin thiomethyltransferase [Aspergillus undulatus]|uniref:gliotoxin thiomethyltransferase n=1 Tax=Aspergillus undulatus TaxID=1810928 RepID=UPI003CCD919A